VLAWTDWSAESIRQSVPRARIISHHPGLDTARFVPATQTPRDVPRVLFVGGRFREKGGEDLLKALDPYMGRELEVDVVTQQEVPGRNGLRVHHLRRDDRAMLDLFQQADLLCLPTYGDAVPWVVLEAMACGTPVVSTRVGAIPELLRFEKCGLTLRPGDIRALRHSVLSLLRDDARRTAMGNRSRAEIERHYDARTQGAALVTLMEEAVARHSSTMPRRAQLAGADLSSRTINRPQVLGEPLSEIGPPSYVERETPLSWRHTPS
jgi:glycosyltransferase involved in cell wall biosynthesis